MFAMTRAGGAGLLCVALCLAAAGCSSKVETASAADAVANVVEKNQKVRPRDVKCPAKIEAKVGGEFTCTFTDVFRRPSIAKVKITRINGKDVSFSISTEKCSDTPRIGFQTTTTTRKFSDPSRC